MKMITVRSFFASPESFAPYNYVCKYTTNLHERYAELAKHIGLQDNLDTPNFGWLNIHILVCEKERCKKCLDIKDVISTKGNKSIEDKGQSKYKSFGIFLDSNEGVELTYPFIVVINECCSELLDEKLLDEIVARKDRDNGIRFIIIADENSEEQPKSKCQVENGTDSNILVSSRGKVNDDIGDELERIVLKTIKEKCETVNKWLIEKKSLVVNKDGTGQSTKRRAFDEACPGFNFNDKENNKHFHNFHASGRSIGYVSIDIEDKQLEVTDKSKADPQTDVQEYSNEKARFISERLQCVDRDTIESLLAEMVALYTCSRVPNYERPDVSVYEEKEISEKLRRDLFDIPNVTGIGYRFTCFVVYTGRGKETKYMEQKIRSVLKENKIDDYEIQSVSEQRNYAKVGNKIRATQICQGRDKPVEGTLGCFANYKSGKDTNMCALISMHVAIYCDSFYISSGLLGKRITTSVAETGLDIAALQLVLNDKNIEICAKFKPETVDDGSVSGSAVGGDGFDLLQGKLNHYSEHLDHSQTDMLCNGQKVYIWGAVSKPGKGVITMRAYQHDGMKSLIQIEDRVPSMVGDIPERFCYAGDSGAIVCAEDSRGRFVHILAMLIGIINEKEMKNNPKIRGKYLTVPLSSGLEELKERTGFTFQICECIDS